QSLPWLAALTLNPTLSSPKKEVYIDFKSGPASLPQFSFVQVYQRALEKDTAFFTENFKDKLVLIGEVNPLTPHLAAPVSADFIYGSTAVELTAHSIFSILQGRNFYTLGALPTFVFIFILTFLALCPYLAKREAGNTYLMLLPSLCMGLCLLASIISFLLGLYLPLVPALTALLIAQILHIVVLTRQRQELGRTSMTALSVYLNPVLAEHIIRHPEILAQGGERREMTVFFSDLAGFTAMAERLSPEELVKILNKYFELMSPKVENDGGIVDKFDGDAIMAFWGSPLLPCRNHAAKAVVSALEQQAVLQKLNVKLKNEGHQPLQALMGLNSGPMVVGNIGATSRLNYTVMGDAVNLASRLVSVN
ncbi:MAG: adenylate/guanylate cyclase domain-containing protein, partial [Candidatus Adiutrix sp.]